MRGTDHQTGHLCGYVNPEAMVPLDHPMREIRPLVNAALERLSPTFEQIYSPIGRPSIPPEQLLRALLFQAFFTIRSERQLMEGDIAYGFLRAILADPRVKRRLSNDHFSVDGTLIDAWASMKSFRPKDGSGSPPGPGRNGERNFRKEKRSNESHASTTDPDARLYRKADGRE